MAEQEYQEGLNNKAIAETHPFIGIRHALAVSFFEIPDNFLKGNGPFKVKSLKQIIDDHKKTILDYYNQFPETKAFPTVDDLIEKINEWQYDFVTTRTPSQTDDTFINFAMNEILNDSNLGYEEADCEDSIGPLCYILNFIFQVPFSSLKSLEAVKFYESLRGPIEDYKDNSEDSQLAVTDISEMLSNL
jgi:hypothetical protein